MLDKLSVAFPPPQTMHSPFGDEPDEPSSRYTISIGANCVPH